MYDKRLMYNKSRRFVKETWGKNEVCMSEFLVDVEV